MLYKFENVVEFTPSIYSKAVRELNATDDQIYGSGDYHILTSQPLGSFWADPRFVDSNTGKLKRAGQIFLLTANDDRFAGMWSVRPVDGVAERGYDAMLKQAGIPKTSEYYAWEPAQHIVAGIRIDEAKFAATSIFRLSEPIKKRTKASEATLQKRAQIQTVAESLRSDLLNYDDTKEFTYRAVRKVAGVLGQDLRQPRSKARTQ